MSKSNNNSRRKFLSLALTGGAALATGKVAAQQPIDTGEKVKMLTPDGQLVEVDKSVLEQVSDRKKINNKDIFKWANPNDKV
ncbi:MAG: twin-arginine translocation signal domain-containing protein [Saprospiraceae bacterium]